MEGQSSFKGKGNLRICSELLEICRFKGDGSNVDLNFFLGGGGHYFSSTAECTAKPDHIYARRKKSKLAGFFFLLGWKQRKAVISDLSLTAR